MGVFTGIRVWVLGVAALIGVVAVAAVVLVASGEPSAQSPRARVSVPGLEADLFADEGELDPAEPVSEVAAYEGIEQLQAAFTADAGHPRLILLVDPI